MQIRISQCVAIRELSIQSTSSQSQLMTLILIHSKDIIMIHLELLITYRLWYLDTIGIETDTGSHLSNASWINEEFTLRHTDGTGQSNELTDGRHDTTNLTVEISTVINDV